jgi:hypothetical protein
VESLSKFYPDIALEEFKAAMRKPPAFTKTVGVVDDSKDSFRIKYEPKPKSHLSIRIDANGAPRWFHATKGWHGLVQT